MRQHPMYPANGNAQAREKVPYLVAATSRKLLTTILASNIPTPAYQSAESDSGEDDYVNSRRAIPTKKQRHHQMQVATGQALPSRAEVRFSARRSRQITNYNEEEEDDFEEEEDDENIPNYGWTTAAEDTGPGIDAVLDHRPKEGIGKSHCVLGLIRANQPFRPRSAAPS